MFLRLRGSDRILRSGTRLMNNGSPLSTSRLRGVENSGQQFNGTIDEGSPVIRRKPLPNLVHHIDFVDDTQTYEAEVDEESDDDEDDEDEKIFKTPVILPAINLQIETHLNEIRGGQGNIMDAQTTSLSSPTSPQSSTLTKVETQIFIPYENDLITINDVHKNVYMGWVLQQFFNRVGNGLIVTTSLISQCDLRFLYLGRTLDFSKTLGENCVPMGAQITLCGRLRGGVIPTPTKSPSKRVQTQNNSFISLDSSSSSSSQHHTSSQKAQSYLKESANKDDDEDDDSDEDDEDDKDDDSSSNSEEEEEEREEEKESRKQVRTCPFDHCQFKCKRKNNTVAMTSHLNSSIHATDRQKPNQKGVFEEFCRETGKEMCPKCHRILTKLGNGRNQRFHPCIVPAIGRNEETVENEPTDKQTGQLSVREWCMLIANLLIDYRTLYLDNEDRLHDKVQVLLRIIKNPRKTLDHQRKPWNEDGEDEEALQHIRDTYKALKFLQEGHASKALACISGKGISLLSTPGVVENIRSKYPQGEDDPIYPDNYADKEKVPKFEVAELKKLLDSKSKHVSGGLDGWKYDDFKVLFKKIQANGEKWKINIDHTYEGLLYIAQDIAEGKFDSSHNPFLTEIHSFLNMRRGCAITKKKGNIDGSGVDIRPLGIGQTLCQIAAGLLWKHPLIQAKFHEVIGKLCDVAHGTKGACEIVKHAVYGAMMTHPHWVAVKLDIKNAFNEIFRQAIIDLIARRIPELGCFDKFNYHELIIRFIDGMSDKLDVRQKSGLAQGCPHSGPLFSAAVAYFATNPTLEQHPRVGKCGISDDTVFYGEVNEVFAAIDTFVLLLRQLGLEIQGAKSVAYCPNGNETIRHHCEERGYKMEDGIVVGGSYIGKTPWVDARVGEDLDKMEANALQKILVLQQEGARLGKDKVLQKALYLLRLCFAPSVIIHLLRTIPPSIMKPHAQRFDKMVYRSLRQMLGDASDHTEINTLRGRFISMAAQLSPKDGGFGLTSAEDLSPYAFVASHLLVGKYVKDMYDRFLDVTDNEAERYFPEVHQLLQDGLLKDVPDFKDWESSNIFHSLELKAQKRIMAMIRPRLLQNVLNIAPNPSSKVQLFSQGGEGGQIMYADPSKYNQGIEDELAKIIYRRRAFMDQCDRDPDTQQECPECNGRTPGANFIDATLSHALVCGRLGQGNLRGMRQGRHFRTTLMLTKLLKQAAAKGIARSTIMREAVVEESNGWNRRLPVPVNPEAHRSDIRVTTNGVDTHYDLIITAASIYNTAHDGCVTKAGVAASWAYNYKVNRYNRHYYVPEKRLHPIAIEFDGRWHPQSRQAVKDFMRTELTDGNTFHEENLSWNMDSLLKVIAVSLARERAKAILKLQQNLRIYPHEEIREVLTQEQ